MWFFFNISFKSLITFMKRSRTSKEVNQVYESRQVSNITHCTNWHPPPLPSPLPSPNHDKTLTSAVFLIRSVGKLVLQYKAERGNKNLNSCYQSVAFVNYLRKF